MGECTGVDGFPHSVCIVDDDVEYARFLADYLGARGCRAVVRASAEALLADGGMADYAFFVVDLTLPGIDGVELISIIRARSEAGLLVTSGRDGPDAFNSVLAAGADMFVGKPVRLDQVYNAIASIHSRAGRGRVPVEPGRVWRLSAEERTLVSPRGVPVGLTRTEAALLRALEAAGGAAMDRSDLARAAGVELGPDNRTLDSAVYRLRRKIEQTVGGPAPLRTVHGVGYRLAGSAA